MQGFNAVTPQAIVDPYCLSLDSPFDFRGEDTVRNVARSGELEEPVGDGVHHDDGSVYYNEMKASTVSVLSSNLLHYGGLNTALLQNLGSAEMVPSVAGMEVVNKGTMVGTTYEALETGHFEKWCGSGLLADHSQHTDISTDTDNKNQHPGERLIAAHSTEQLNTGKIGDHKALCRLAQNREAARKSRMRKRAYVQQLENSQLKLTQLEQALKREHQQEISARIQINMTKGIFLKSGFSADQNCLVSRNVLPRQMLFLSPIEKHCKNYIYVSEYMQWVHEHHHLINDLRSVLSSRSGDNEVRLVVDEVMSHYDKIFWLKNIAARSDVLHILSGIWKTPVERCFMWLGGFRCSAILKIIAEQIKPLTEQQQVRMYNLQESLQQAEEALTQGIEALQQSLVNSLSSRYPRDVTQYMGQMTTAMSNVTMLEDFVRQADLLRQKTLQQLQRILTTGQCACALLAIHDFRTRLCALSSLWLERPKE